MKRRAVAPSNPVPVTTTLTPTAPLVGAKLTRFGLTVKVPPLVVEPVGVVTPIFPEVAPAGTIAVILIGLTTVKEAVFPLNFTEVVPVKLAPLMVTLAPITPLVGKKLAMRGATVKLPAVVAVPPAVVTASGPVVALAGTVAVIWVLEATVNAAARPLNLTAVAPVRFDPAITTCVPGAPLLGDTELITGAGFTVKSVALMPVPPGAVTAMRPVVAGDGTVAVILTAELTVKLVAAAPLKVTEVAPVKLAPLIAILAPIPPAVGVKLVIRGATEKAVAVVTVPPGAVTLMGPVVALAGTVPVI